MSTSRTATVAVAVVLACAGCDAPSDTSQTDASPRFLAAATQDDGSAAYFSLIDQLYVGYYGRPADAAGRQFWAKVLKDGGAATTLRGLREQYGVNATVRNVVDQLGNSEESRTLYPGSAGVFIDSIYRNLLNREPDAAGRAFWVNAIERGLLTRGSGALELMAGASGDDADSLARKAALASEFTAQLVANGGSGHYDGVAMNTAARAFLALVGAKTDLAVMGLRARQLADHIGTRHLPCASGSTLTALTPDAGIARMGASFSSTLYDPAITSNNGTYRPQPVRVQVMRGTQPQANCDVVFEAAAPEHGWIFPQSTATDSQGLLQAWWIAGSANAQRVQASIVTADGERLVATVRGEAVAHRSRSQSIHINFPVGHWDRLSVDLTTLSWAPTTYYAAATWPGAYTGVQTHQLLFSVWDANGLSPTVLDKGSSTCVNFGGEGTGIKCETPFVPKAGATYRFDIEVAATVPNAVDYTVYFTDLADGRRIKLASMRYHAVPSYSYATGFVEDWGIGSTSCLSTPKRQAIWSNVAYREKATGRILPVRSATGTAVFQPDYNEICANYRFSAEGTGFKLSSGGDEVGQPLNLPGGLKSYPMRLP